MTLQIKKMDLFDAPFSTLLVHAVNCKGAWGSGIAAKFKDRFPLAFFDYKMDCNTKANELLGTCAIYPNLYVPKTHYVGCLFTSKGYGKNVDDPKTIIASTRMSLTYIIKEIDTLEIKDVYSNKFNSGLFNVPWQKTEEILKELVGDHKSINWTVCEF